MTEEKKATEVKPELESNTKEKRIMAITSLYYSNPRVLEAMVKFSQNREVVPRYFESFGKRPDHVQYASDIMGLVNKGATSFHASEELWNDPLALNSDMTPDDMDKLRKSWDLLIDVDSPFLDCSRIATKLIISALEHHGIKNYGLKFSGSKGFHILISGKAFPKEFGGFETRIQFPEWPRAISQYLMSYIRRDYNAEVGKILSVEDVVKRTNIKKEDLRQVICVHCNKPAKKGAVISLFCPVCEMKLTRKDPKTINRKLRCLNGNCAGVLEAEEGTEKEYYYCENCKDVENEKMPLSSDKNPDSFEETRGIDAEKVANLDLVLVAPRHLFRMPYSLHEKTSLASIVIKKEQLDTFSPKDANPLNVKVLDYTPNNEEGEAKKLLAAALDWKRGADANEEKVQKKYENYEKIDISGVTEEMFPKPIKKLLKGLKDGKKRGLFVLITFLRSCGFSPEYINGKVRDWNKLNEPPLREGYVKSQIDWHLKQRKSILPPNYENDSFYRDLNLLDEKPEVKNPIVEIMRAIRWRRG